MNLNVGYIPYLNMVPFHQGFGPAPLRVGSFEIHFRKHSPRGLGIEAAAGQIDAGALSLIDIFQLGDTFEPLGEYGIGVKRAAGSVLLFSKVPLSELSGMCAVTDETSTSVRLLQTLVEKRHNRTDVRYGRVSPALYDGSADALLLIGDEALRARHTGIKGLPVVTDLATEWYVWQGVPFVFARWMVRKELPQLTKELLEEYLEKSLEATALNRDDIAHREGRDCSLSAREVVAYWDGFLFKLTPEHEKAIETFKTLSESVCLTQ